MKKLNLRQLLLKEDFLIYHFMSIVQEIPLLGICATVFPEMIIMRIVITNAPCVSVLLGQIPSPAVPPTRIMLSITFNPFPDGPEPVRFRHRRLSQTKGGITLFLIKPPSCTPSIRYTHVIDFIAAITVAFDSLHLLSQNDCPACSKCIHLPCR